MTNSGMRLKIYIYLFCFIILTISVIYVFFQFYDFNTVLQNIHYVFYENWKTIVSVIREIYYFVLSLIYDGYRMFLDMLI